MPLDVARFAASRNIRTYLSSDVRSLLSFASLKDVNTIVRIICSPITETDR